MFFLQFLSFFKRVRDVSRTQSSIKMEPIAKIANGSKDVFRTTWKIYDGALCVNSEQLKMFFPKSFILDVPLGSEYASETVGNYCHQKLHLKYLIRPWICLCLYWVWQFLNVTSKICYERTQKNGKKHVPFVPRNTGILILDGKSSIRCLVAWFKSL